MLKTNLATRPFYNERAVQCILGALAVLVLAVSAFNAFELLRLTDSQRTLGAHAVDSEREAARLRSEAATIRAQINARELEVVANAALEANSIIDQRAFSWSDLFDELEHTLPDDVRITAVDPALNPPGAAIVNLPTVRPRAGARVGRGWAQYAVNPDDWDRLHRQLDEAVPRMFAQFPMSPRRGDVR